MDDEDMAALARRLLGRAVETLSEDERRLLVYALSVEAQRDDALAALAGRLDAEQCFR